MATTKHLHALYHRVTQKRAISAMLALSAPILDGTGHGLPSQHFFVCLLIIRHCPYLGVVCVAAYGAMLPVVNGLVGVRRRIRRPGRAETSLVPHLVDRLA